MTSPTAKPQRPTQNKTTQPAFVEGVEAELAALLADASARRRVLPPMPRARRALVHEYASEAWGLSSSSTGQEPRRAISVFKTAASGAPATLLSLAALLVDAPAPAGAGGSASASAAPRGGYSAAAAATAVSAARLQQQQPEHALRLVDVSPGVDVRRVLQRWADDIVRVQDGGGAALVVFSRAAALRDCLDTLGGGVRGAFRVDRAYRSAGAGAGGGAAAAGGASGSGATGSGAAPASSNFVTLQRPTAALRGGGAGAGSAGAGSGSGGWQTAGGGKAAAAAAAAAAKAAEDPWADEAPARRARGGAAGAAAAGAASPPPPPPSAAVGRVVLDDWELEEGASEPDLPRRAAPEGLVADNRWAALGGGDD